MPVSPPLIAREHIAELAATWYEGDQQKAFRHAAFHLVAPDPLLSDAQIIELTAIDRTGDLEIDGWFADESGESLLLFQSVGGRNKVAEAKVTKFWEAPEQVLEPSRLAATGNQSVRELSALMSDRLRDGFSVRQVFASRGGFERAAVAFARPKARTERGLNLGDGTTITAQATFELITEEELAALFDDFRAGFRSPRIDIELKVHEKLCYPIDAGELRSLRATMSAKELIRVFRMPGMGFRLFSLNPRGPLAGARVNKNITRSLDSDQGRETFHLLNNGLCATCDDFHLARTRLKVTNLQIVNGCQTTVALNERSDQELAQTMVDLKLVVADTELATSIAIASNSQTALRAKDYASFEKQQLQLQQEFASLMPPWYYEIKQGYWRYVLDDRDKARFKTGRRKRHIEVQPLAQSSLAFIGFPAEALDRVRFVFEGIRTAEERDAYERAFPPTVKARQLLLPWKMLDFLEREVEQRVRFSTFHVLWLCADMLREHYGLSSPGFFSLDTTQRLLDTLDVWMPGISRLANGACKIAFRRAVNILGADLDLRNLFRSGELGHGVVPAELLIEALNGELQIAVENSRDPRDHLPS